MPNVIPPPFTPGDKVVITDCFVAEWVNLVGTIKFCGPAQSLVVDEIGVCRVVFNEGLRKVDA
jgi:hypothetical protein